MKAKKNPKPISVGKKQVQPTLNNKPSPRTVNNNSYLDKEPSWCFKNFDFEHTKWGFNQNNCKGDFPKLLQHLSQYERQTWGEIKSNKKQNHTVQRIDLVKEANEFLETLGIEDIFSLRLGGKIRVYGYIENGVMAIFWIDREHEIYPYQKKHT